MQPTNLLEPGDGFPTVPVAASGAIGRLVPEDVIGLIRHPREHASAAA